jgi:hypothetical protein
VVAAGVTPAEVPPRIAIDNISETTGNRSGSEFGVADFVELGATLRVPERAIRSALTELADRADRWLPDLDALPFGRGKLTKLRRVIEHRRSRLSK